MVTSGLILQSRLLLLAYPGPKPAVANTCMHPKRVGGNQKAAWGGSNPAWADIRKFKRQLSKYALSTEILTPAC